MKTVYRLSAIALAMMLGTAQAADQAEPGVWRFGDDLYKISDPSSPWYYGWRHALGQPTQLLNGVVTQGNPRGRYTLYNLSGRRDQFQPGVWFNAGTAILNSVKPGETALRPGPQRQPVFARWTAPAADTYTIESRFGAGNAPAADCYVIHNGRVLFSALNETRERVFNTVLALKAGDQLEFVAVNALNTTDNQVPLEVTIRAKTTVPPQPEPPVVVPLPADGQQIQREIRYDGRGRVVGFQVGNGRYQGQLNRRPDGSEEFAVLEDGRETRYTEMPGAPWLEVLRDGSRFGLLFDPTGRMVERMDQRGVAVRYQRSLTPDGTMLRIDDADRGASEMNFTAVSGRLAHTRDARGMSLSPSYDARNRLIGLTYSNGERSTFDYEASGLGRMVLLQNESGRRIYEYLSGGGPLRRISQVVGSKNLEQLFDYQEPGQRLTRHTYHSGRAVEFVWTKQRITEVRFNGMPLLSQIVYHGDGQPKSWVWPTGQIWRAALDQGGRTIGVTLADRNEIVGYGAQGTVQTLSAGYGDQLYQHQAAGPLSEARIGTNQYAYDYDLSGNRSVQRVNGNEIRYDILPNRHRVNRVTGLGMDRLWSYDPIGNRVSDGNGVAELYNAANRLVRYGNWTYSYGADGARLSKKAPDGRETLFLYAADGKLLGEYDSSGQPIDELVWFADRPVALWRAGELYLILTDHLKTPRQLVSLSSRKVVWNWSIDEPFGVSTPDEDPDRDGQRFVFNLRFAGHYFDVESKRHYAFSRYYEPASGRYLQPEPNQPFALTNPYAYVGGTPLLHSSPLGEERLAGSGRIRLGKLPGGVMTTTGGQAIMQVRANAQPLVESWTTRPLVDLAPAPIVEPWRDEDINRLRSSYRY
ncbi:RHS repeat domain-containing protein [Chitinimonas lacunae]|uniref:RHS repeat domain-containing protein n=1 Tax=Chitinimonas lacunae TaxID=1963018 RepID=A0ABV8MR10_9NEIS